MAAWNAFRFTTSAREDAEEFVAEYVLDALERIETLDSCESATFAYGFHPETGERSVVTVAFLGDADPVLEAEKSNWQEYEADGRLVEWEQVMVMEKAEMESIMGKHTASLWPQLAALSADMAQVAHDRFEPLDRKPAAVDTYPDDDSDIGPIGWWAVLHTVTVQLNYTLDEEMDAYLYGIEHTLRNIAEFQGEETADARLDEIEDELERMRDDVKEGRLFTM
ncbi:hypothetical protein GCM10009647_090540 [Streptomyces sanglieri]